MKLVKRKTSNTQKGTKQLVSKELIKIIKNSDKTQAQSTLQLDNISDISKLDCSGQNYHIQEYPQNIVEKNISNSYGSIDENPSDYGQFSLGLPLSLPETTDLI